MGITRHSLHKRRATGGKKVKVHKKRKYDMGRAPANTKLSNEQRTHEVRTRGGHTKYRALHLHTGNFSWPGEARLPHIHHVMCTRHGRPFCTNRDSLIIISTWLVLFQLVAASRTSTGVR